MVFTVISESPDQKSFSLDGLISLFNGYSMRFYKVFNTIFPCKYSVNLVRLTRIITSSSEECVAWRE